METPGADAIYLTMIVCLLIVALLLPSGVLEHLLEPLTSQLDELCHLVGTSELAQELRAAVQQGLG